MVNAKQIHTYLETYSAVAGQFPMDKLEQLKQLFDAAAAQTESAVASSASPDLLRAFERLQRFHEETVAICRQMWTSFDTTLMAVGIGCAALALVACVAWLLFLSLSQSDSVGTQSCNSSLGFRLQKQLRKTVLNGTCSSVVVPVVLVALRCATFWSNSYIEAEDKVLQFLLITLVAVSVAKRPSPLSAVTLLGCAALPLTSAGKHESFFSSGFTDGVAMGCFLPAVIVLVAVLGTKKWVATGLFPRLLVTCGMLLVMGYWLSQLLLEGHLPWLTRIALPRCVYLLSIVGVVAMVFAGPTSSTPRDYLMAVSLPLIPSLALILGPLSSWPLLLMFSLVRVFALLSLPSFVDAFIHLIHRCFLE
jgi:hypothetical protein